MGVKAGTRVCYYSGRHGWHPRWNPIFGLGILSEDLYASRANAFVSVAFEGTAASNNYRACDLAIVPLGSSCGKAIEQARVMVFPEQQFVWNY